MTYAYIPRLFNMNTVTVKRKSGGDYTSGYFGGQTTTTLTISASVQPTPGKELLLMPEGDRLRDWKNVYTKTPLLAEDILIIDDGTQYEVQKDSEWTGNIITLQHYETKAVRLDYQNE